MSLDASTCLRHGRNKKSEVATTLLRPCPTHSRLSPFPILTPHSLCPLLSATRRSSSPPHGGLSFPDVVEFCFSGIDEDSESSEESEEEKPAEEKEEEDDEKKSTGPERKEKKKKGEDWNLLIAAFLFYQFYDTLSEPV